MKGTTDIRKGKMIERRKYHKGTEITILSELVAVINKSGTVAELLESAELDNGAKYDIVKIYHK